MDQSIICHLLLIHFKTKLMGICLAFPHSVCRERHYYLMEVKVATVWEEEVVEESVGSTSTGIQNGFLK